MYVWKYLQIVYFVNVPIGREQVLHYDKMYRYKLVTVVLVAEAQSE